MANLLLLSALILTIVLTLQETVTLRLIYTDEVVLSFDFLFIGFTLYPSRKKSGRKKKSRRGIFERFELAKRIRATAKYAFRHAKITVQELNLKQNELDPAKYALKLETGYAILSLIIAYLSLEIDSLRIEDDLFKLPRRIEVLPSPQIDLTLEATLYNSIIAYLIYKRKPKGTRRQNYAAVRKQNG